LKLNINRHRINSHYHRCVQDATIWG